MYIPLSINLFQCFETEKIFFSNKNLNQIYEKWNQFTHTIIKQGQKKLNSNYKSECFVHCVLGCDYKWMFKRLWCTVFTIQQLRKLSCNK